VTERNGHVAPAHTARLLDLLREVRARGSGWSALCPAHPDTHPSLDIDLGDDGRTLLICRSGDCTAEQIMRAVGLQPCDLFPPKGAGRQPFAPTPSSQQRSRSSNGTTSGDERPMTLDEVEVKLKGWGKVVGLWHYPKADGTPHLLVVRVDPHDGSKKQFPQYHAVGDRWAKGASTGPKPLYKLQKLVADSKRKATVAEGEKCCDALDSIGVLATTSPGGSKNAKGADWSPLAGWTVDILADYDQVGLDYAADVATILRSQTPPAKVRILTLPQLLEAGDEALKEGDDVFDVIQRRRSRGVEDDEIAESIARKIEGAETKVGAIDTAWQTLPANILSQRPEPRLYVLRLTTMDGTECAPRQGDGFASSHIVAVLSAAGGTGKSMFLLLLAVCIILGRRFLAFDVGAEFVGRRCCLIFGEEVLAEVHRRLWYIAKHLQLTDSELREIEQKLVVLPLQGKHCGLIAPGASGALPTPTAELAALRAKLNESTEQFALIGLDPQSRLLPGSEGGNDAATFAVQVCEQLAEAPGNPLVIVSGHSSKEARRKGDVDARGVTGLTDAARLHLTLAKKDCELQFAAPKTNYALELEGSITLKKDYGGVLRLATDEEVKVADDLRGAQEAELVEADARICVEALRVAGKAKSIDAIGVLAKLGTRRCRPAVALAMSRDEIIKKKLPVDGAASCTFYVVPEPSAEGDE
jgi:hypothetical protein